MTNESNKHSETERKPGEPCVPDANVQVIPPGEASLIASGIAIGLTLGFALGALFGAKLGRR